MMNRELLIDCSANLTRIALFENGLLCEIHQEPVCSKKLTDSLFLGRVQAIRPSVCAAFVDIGEELNAFLPLDENASLRCGDMIIVQGAAVQAVKTKGLRVSTTLNLSGKWLVLVPNSSGVRVSKKIKDTALREALIAALEPVCPDHCGLIVRTASSGVTHEALFAEADELFTRWQEIEKAARGKTKPALLYEPPALTERMIRDLGSTLQRIVTNSPACMNQLADAKARSWLGADTMLELFEERSQLLSDAYGLDAQVDKALRKRVWLDCGGYLVFDFCEAMTVIDVNSGKMVLGRDTEDTALRVNLEAAQEIALQLRLRDVSGIIVVDFIDMESAEHREMLLSAFKDACSQDRTPITVYGISRLGLVELTRKRKGASLRQALQSPCKSCGGEGMFLCPQETAYRVLRQLRRMELAGQRGPYLICTTESVSVSLQEMRLPLETADVFVIGEKGRHAERFEIKQLAANAALPKGAVQLTKR